MEQEESLASLAGLVFPDCLAEEDFKVPKVKMGEMVSLVWGSRVWKACLEFLEDRADLEQVEILVIQVLRVFPALGLPSREEEGDLGQKVPGGKPECPACLAFPAPPDSKVPKGKTAEDVLSPQMERRETLEILDSPEFPAFLDLRVSWAQTVLKVCSANLV